MLVWTMRREEKHKIAYPLLEAKQLVKPTLLLLPLLLLLVVVAPLADVFVVATIEAVAGTGTSELVAELLLVLVVVVVLGLGGVLVLRTLKISADKAVRTTS